jgi:oligopeptide/dipeptide ABC transporter ATP-binding protein
VTKASSDPQAPILEVRGLSVTYKGRGSLFMRRAPVLAVDGVELELRRGETLAVVGESGSGKSTVARAICGLVPYEGSVRLSGQDLARLSPRQRRAVAPSLQMIFQNPYSSLDPTMTISDCIAEPLVVHSRLDPERRALRVLELLRAVSLGPEFASRFPSQLSGGQRQRVAIARAVALDPSVLICDEAVSALDVSTQTQVIALLKRLVGELNIGCIFITHDLALTRYIADRVAVLYFGKLMEEGPTSAVFAAPANPYTEALLSAVPVPDPKLQRSRERATLAGELPNVMERPRGCPFHPRCAYAMDVCQETWPEETRTPDGRRVHCHLETSGRPLRDHVRTAPVGG